MTIFSKIIAGEIPCYKIAENEKFFAFLDIFPLMPINSEKDISFSHGKLTLSPQEFKIIQQKIIANLG